MKRLFNSIMAVATIAAAITACTKEEVSNIGTPAEHKIAVTAEADATRTYYDEAQQQMNWNATGEKLKVFEYNKSEWDFKAYTTTGYELDGRSAKFSVTVYGASSSEGFMYSAIYPAANNIEFNNSSRKAFKIQIPAAQTPAESSFDPDADLLIAKPIDLMERPSELTFRFHRVAALAKMTLKGIAAGEKLDNIEITASKPLAGVLVADLSTGKLADAAVADGKGLTLTLDSRVATGEDAIWFTALPCTLAADDTLTIKVETDKATYEKEIAFTADKPFALESANIAAFGVTGMKRSEKAQSNVFTKLSDTSLLNADDQLILVYNSNVTNYALAKKLFSDGSLDQASVSITNNQINSIGENVEVITLHDGKTEGTFLFELSDGTYLNISGYKFEKKDAESADSWQITFGSYGKITIKDVTTSSYYNSIKYDDNETCFVCDSPNGYYTNDITAIYHCAIGTPKAALAAPANLTATAAGNVVTVAWDAVEGAADYTVTCGSESKTVTETTVEFTLEYDKSYNVSVVANPADTSANKVSAAATATVATEKEPVVEPSNDFVELTDASTLKVGDELIFVYDNGDGKVVAMSTKSGDDGFKSTAIDIKDKKIASPADDVMIVTLAEGATDGSFRFQYGSQYLTGGSWSLSLTGNSATAYSWTFNGKNITGYYNNSLIYDSKYDVFCTYTQNSNVSVYVRSGAAGDVGGDEDDNTETMTFPIEGAEEGAAIVDVITGKLFSVTCSNATWTDKYDDGTGLRLAKSNNASFTIRPLNGKKLTKIEITAAKDEAFKATADEGTLDNNTGWGATSVWTGNEGISVKFTITSGVSVVGQIKVTCE